MNKILNTSFSVSLACYVTRWKWSALLVSLSQKIKLSTQSFICASHLYARISAFLELAHVGQQFHHNWNSVKQIALILCFFHVSLLARTSGVHIRVWVGCSMQLPMYVVGFFTEGLYMKTGSQCFNMSGMVPSVKLLERRYTVLCMNKTPLWQSSVSIWPYTGVLDYSRIHVDQLALAVTTRDAVHLKHKGGSCLLQIQRINLSNMLV